MKFLFILFIALCAFGLIRADDADNGSTEEGSTDGDDAADATPGNTNEKDDEEMDEEGESPYKQFVCNLQYKRIGCYASVDEEEKEKKKPLKRSAIILKDVPSDKEKFNEELPKHACQCANEALTSGNAIFGLMNYTECWSGPDDSSYDREGPSNECVTFDFAPCEPSNEICTGKELANFMYYVDALEHNKTPEEVQKELQEEREKLEDPKKKKKKGKGKEKKENKEKQSSIR